MNRRPTRLWSAVLSQPNGVGSSVVTVVVDMSAVSEVVSLMLGWLLVPGLQHARRGRLCQCAGSDGSGWGLYS